jgi:tetratricopeptide (TPR) repeat protein
MIFSRTARSHLPVEKTTLTQSRLIAGVAVVSVILLGCASGAPRGDSGTPDLVRAADADYDRGDLDRAQQKYVRAVAKQPSLAHAHMRLGVIAYRSGDLDEARRQFTVTLQADPKNTQASYNLAVLNLNEARHWLNQYLDVAAASPQRSKAAGLLSDLDGFARSQTRN